MALFFLLRGGGALTATNETPREGATMAAVSVEKPTAWNAPITKNSGNAILRRREAYRKRKKAAGVGASPPGGSTPPPPPRRAPPEPRQRGSARNACPGALGSTRQHSSSIAHTPTKVSTENSSVCPPCPANINISAANVPPTQPEN